MTPVALSPLNPAARIRNSQTDPDLRVKRGKFYKITGHLRNYTFHGMLVAFHWWPTTIPSVAIHSFRSPSPFVLFQSPRADLSMILFIIESPPKKERKKINHRKDGNSPLRSVKRHRRSFLLLIPLFSPIKTSRTTLSFLRRNKSRV